VSESCFLFFEASAMVRRSVWSGKQCDAVTANGCTYIGNF
jgi:hypothetical protein